MGLFDKIRKKNIEEFPYDLSSCINGEVVSLSKVKDEAFSTGALGQGVGIIPSSSKVCAPISGEITMLFPTLHAIGIKTEIGIEILIHIGLDTVGLEGNGFTALVSPNQKVVRGQGLIEVDFEYIKEQGLDTTVLMVVTNCNQYSTINIETGNRSMEDKIMHLEEVN